ncbi:hypothetical protein FRC09_001117, partial [Ceratobasidium sp. 395]
FADAPRDLQYNSNPGSPKSPPDEDKVEHELDDEEFESEEHTARISYITDDPVQGKPVQGNPPSPDQTSTIITHVAPAQTGVVTAPALPTIMTADMKIVYQQMGALGRFNDTGVVMSEAEYQSQFKSIVEDCTDEVKAKLWVENLNYAGPAWWWHKALTEKAVGQALAKKWSTLEVEVEKRWPTPVLNIAAYKRVTHEAFESHVLDLPAMADALLNDLTITDADRVAHTLKHSIPYTVAQLLPKRHDYGEDFVGLCKDIGELNPRSLYYTWKDRADVDYLLEKSMSGLLISPQPQSPPPATPLGPVSALRTPLYSTPGRPGILGQHQNTPPKAPPSAHSSQRPECSVSFVPDKPPHMPDSVPPNLLLPPSTPAQPRTPVPPQTKTRILKQGPASPSAEFLARLQEVQKPNTALPEFVVNDTPEEHGLYNAKVDKFDVNHGALGPWFTRPCPLSPGTRRQTIDLCTVCAKGNHPTYLCPAVELGGCIPEQERTYREMLVGDLRRAAKKGRAGAQLNTPTPLQRTRDINQVEYEESDLQVLEEDKAQEDPFAWYYNQGKGQAARVEDVGQACLEPSLDFYADRVIDLCNMEGGKELPLKVEASLLNKDGRDGGVGVLATINRGAMLCVLDSSVWAKSEQSLGPLEPSRVICRMANGVCTRLKGTGKAWIGVDQVRALVNFEVLDSRGAFKLLIGKTWLRKTDASQDFSNDTLILPLDSGTVVIENQNPKIKRPEPAPEQPPTPTNTEPESLATAKEDDEPVANQDEPTPTNEQAEPHDDENEAEQPVVRRSRRLAARAKNNPFWVSVEAVEEMERAWPPQFTCFFPDAVPAG